MRLQGDDDDEKRTKGGSSARAIPVRVKKSRKCATDVHGLGRSGKNRETVRHLGAFLESVLRRKVRKSGQGRQRRGRIAAVRWTLWVPQCSYERFCVCLCCPPSSYQQEAPKFSPDEALFQPSDPYLVHSGLDSAIGPLSWIGSVLVPDVLTAAPKKRGAEHNPAT